MTDLISRTYEAIAFGQTSIEDGVDQIFDKRLTARRVVRLCIASKFNPDRVTHDRGL